MNSSDGGNEGYPVCGLQVKRPLKIKVLRYASLVLAVAGLALLYLFSVNRDLPVISIGSITPTMNFACVRITGEVVRDAAFSKAGGIVFTVKDGSGEITVMSSRVQAQTLKTAAKLPRRGDRIEVTGCLSVSAGQDVKLRLQSSERLTLNRRRISAVPSAVSCIKLDEVVAEHQGEYVAVNGVLKLIDVPGPGVKTPYVLTLEEGNAELAVVFWDDVFQGLEQKLPIPGKRINVRGRIEVYNGIVQLRVKEAGDLRVAESL
jgi:DNA/RNA endonuclease YhcR with UshA esterase domain